MALPQNDSSVAGVVVKENQPLDYLDSRPVAALVYRRRQHVINLFTWPTSQPDWAIRTFDRQGYHVFDWTKDHVTYWAVSDLNPTELRQFAEMLRSSE